MTEKTQLFWYQVEMTRMTRWKDAQQKKKSELTFMRCFFFFALLVDRD